MMPVAIWIALIIIQTLGGFGLIAWEVWREQTRTHANECDRTQKGYTYKDRERGSLYWYLRSKHKLSRQVHGLQEQLAIAREQQEETERLYKGLRDWVKEMRSDV